MILNRYSLSSLFFAIVIAGSIIFTAISYLARIRETQPKPPAIVIPVIGDHEMDF